MTKQYTRNFSQMKEAGAIGSSNLRNIPCLCSLVFVPYIFYSAPDARECGPDFLVFSSIYALMVYVFEVK